MTYGSCTLYCSWLCWYLHIPLLIFVCYIQSMKQTWVFVSETNKARSKSKTLVFIPIVFLRAIISLEDFSCLSYLHRLMSPLIVEQWPLMLSQVTSPLMVCILLASPWIVTSPLSVSMLSTLPVISILMIGQSASLYCSKGLPLMRTLPSIISKREPRGMLIVLPL